MKIEISKERAEEIYRMMEFLKTRKYYIKYDTFFEGMCEVFRLRDETGILIGEVEKRFERYFYTDY